MEIINYVVMGLLLFFIISRILPPRGVKQISTTDLKRELANKQKQFIDVRTPGEFQRNKIKGFKNLPLNELAQMAKSKLAKEKEVVVICQSGMRSQKACKILKKSGFTNVTNVKGGISSWR